MCYNTSIGWKTKSSLTNVTITARSRSDSGLIWQLNTIHGVGKIDAIMPEV